MAGILRKSQPNRMSRRRRNEANRPQPTVGITIQSVATDLGSPDLTIVFDGPVSLKGTPQYTTNVVGAVPLSAAMSNPTTLVLTFDQDVSAATVLNVPYEEPAVRNSSGGFVTPTSVSI
jgi:hypothetical protein